MTDNKANLQKTWTKSTKTLFRCFLHHPAANEHDEFYAPTVHRATIPRSYHGKSNLLPLIQQAFPASTFWYPCSVHINPYHSHVSFGASTQVADWQRASCLYQIHPWRFTKTRILECSLLEQLEDENRRRTGWPKITWKTAVKTMHACLPMSTSA